MKTIYSVLMRTQTAAAEFAVGAAASIVSKNKKWRSPRFGEQHFFPTYDVVHMARKNIVYMYRLFTAQCQTPPPHPANSKGERNGHGSLLLHKCISWQRLLIT